MSIALYQFENANGLGNKEAVIVPNVPTLVNRLIASEANAIKDKINEIIPNVNASMPTPFLNLKLIAKGEQSGIANTGAGLEIGDIVSGFKEIGVFWEAAKYLGGDPNDRNNYQLQSPIKFEPAIFTAATTGVNQDFTLPIGFLASTVFKSRGLLYKTTEWEQNDEILTILVNTNTGNTIYVIAQ